MLNYVEARFLCNLVCLGFGFGLGLVFFFPILLNVYLDKDPYEWYAVRNASF